MAVVTKGCTTIITAENVLTFRRLHLLRILTVTDLPQQCLMLELCLYLAFFFSHSTLVKESIRFLLQCLNIVLIKHFCTVQLLD